MYIYTVYVLYTYIYIYIYIYTYTYSRNQNSYLVWSGGRTSAASSAAFGARSWSYDKINYNGYTYAK